MNTFIDRVNAIVQQNQQPTMSAPTEPAYPDAGIGALENVANGVPRQTMISNQPHMLAYINPQEEQALRDMGGSGLPGPGGIPAYDHWWGHSAAQSFGNTVSNVTNTIRDTASNVYDTVSTAATNTFGDQGSVETFFDTYVYDFDQDSTPDTTVYGTGPSEVITSGPIIYTDSNGVEHSTQAAADAADVILAARANPLTTTSTKTKEQLIAEARAAGQTVYAWNGNYEPVPDEVVDPVETTNSVVAQDFGQKFDQYGNKIVEGALPTGSNSVRETIANLITPFDGAKYIDGVLTNTTTGADMTGGGTADGLFGENYVYGVSDDPTTGTALDTIGMSEKDANIAVAKQTMLQDIPPSDLAYFGSFFANRAIPIFGGYLAGKMLDSGIEDRRAIMDAEIAALEAGATPRYNDANEYIGHYTEEDDLANTFGSGNIYTENYEGASTVNYGLDESNKVIGDGSYVKALDDLEGGSSAQTFSDGDPVVKSIYNRFRISGSTAGLPFYMSKWMDGVDFDERLEKVMVDGKVMYKNTEGDVISAEDLKNALKYDDDGNIIETEE